MTLFKGIEIQLLDRVQTGSDPFGAPIWEEVEVAVENVLVAPVSSEDIINERELTGKTIVYELAIPKGDSRVWEGRRVKFFGRQWRVVGIPVEGIESLIPLDWNRKVRVEAFE